MVAGVADVYSSVNLSVGAGRFAQAFAGSPLAAAIAAMTAGSWADVTGTNINEMTVTGPDNVSVAPTESAPSYSLLDWCNKGWFGADIGVLGLLGTAQGFTSEAVPGAHGKALWFDAPSNAWNWLWNPTGSAVGHVYDQNVSVPDKAGYVYRRNYNNPKIYRAHLSDLASGFADTGWTSGPTQGVVAIEVLPEYGTQGGLLLACDSTYSTSCIYDCATGTKTTIPSLSVATYCAAIYVPAMQSVVCGGSPSADAYWSVNAALQVNQITMGTKPAGVSVTQNTGGAALVADPAGRAMAWTSNGGYLYSIDWQTGQYTQVSSATAGGSYAPAIALHGYNALLWIQSGGRSNNVTTNRVVLYKVA